MNFQKILVTGLIGGVFSFFLGWLLWGIIFKDAMPDNVPGLQKSESDMVMWAMVLSCLFLGLLLAYIFVQWSGISTWQSGLTAGAIIGFLLTCSVDLGLFSMTNMHTVRTILMDIGINTFYYAAIGAVMGWWLGRK